MPSCKGAPWSSITPNWGPGQETARGPGANPVFLGGRKEGRGQGLPESWTQTPGSSLYSRAGPGSTGATVLQQTHKAGSKFCLALRGTSVTQISSLEWNPVGQWLLGCLLYPPGSSL